MTDVINKVYVINLDKRPDRWKDIQLNFSETGIKLNRWKGVLGKDLSEEEIKKMTTVLGDNLCSHSMIGCWLSHVTLWKHIVKNNEDNILILEDDAYPIDNFNTLLKEHWKHVPDDWDVVYLGCAGSCDKGGAFDKLYGFITGQKNEDIYKDGKLIKNIYKPSYPLCSHAYMISNKGAKKLLNQPQFKKMTFSIDNVIAALSVNKGFNIYAMDPLLIHQNFDTNYSDNQNGTHPMLNNIFSKMNIKSQFLPTTDSLYNIEIIKNRKLDISITFLKITLFFISLVIGFFGSNTIKRGYLYILALLYFIELFGKINIKKVKELVTEVIIVLLGLSIGEKLRVTILK